MALKSLALVRRAICSAAVLTGLVWLGSSRGLAQSAPDWTHIAILGTTDLHGHIYPVDYYTNRPKNIGLAKIASLIDVARLQVPNLLLVDCGDTLQGTPLEYYHNRVNNAPADPMMLAMNALHYDAMAVGNHDYNFGLEVQGKARGEAHFPWLSANTYKVGTEEGPFQPYLVKEVDGVRVGILGLTTGGIPTWEEKANYAGLEFRAPLSEAKKWVAILKAKERADVVVLIMHLGLEMDLATGIATPGQAPLENAAVAIAEQVPGIDLIFMGHTHRNVPSVVIHGALLTQASYWGDHLARADLYMGRTKGGAWEVKAKAAETIAVTSDTEADPGILKLAEPYHVATQAWLDRKIGESAQELSAVGAVFHPTAILDLVERTELEAGKADVALASPFNPQAKIPKGPVTVRDLYGIYVYENTLEVIEITGAQLEAALEHSARYFKPYVQGKTAADLVDYRIPAYNFDIAAGVTYDIDLKRPPGQRIENLLFHGAPLAPERKLRLAVNNYRVNGGGGYTMFKDAPVLSHASEEIRNLLIDWVERHHDIPTEPMNNWRVLP